MPYVHTYVSPGTYIYKSDNEYIRSLNKMKVFLRNTYVRTYEAIFIFFKQSWFLFFNFSKTYVINVWSLSL